MAYLPKFYFIYYCYKEAKQKNGTVDLLFLFNWYINVYIFMENYNK